MTARNRATIPPAEGSRFGPVILIADDSATMRIVTKHALEREGLQTIEAATPLEVLSAAADFHPDLVLLDITFATGALTDGYQLCRVLRDVPDLRETPIVLVSGHDGILDRVRGRLAGATDYITKPFEMVRLVARVRELAFVEWVRRQERGRRQS
jgi:twitching motility two-component system response regulator PilG